MKSYTDLEQSKKLAEILSPESADMEYILEHWIDEKTHRHKEGYYEIPVVKVDDDCQLQPITLPCWSLAALFDILPDDTNIIKDKSDTENEKYMCTVGVKGDIIPTFGKNPVDACYEMILKLHELKIL